ncbi:hypothetical protein [Bordetella bronchialis]|uniref:Uncharacterized protein n=1 Tax=Bordetella bronchialis TaxID=463025 RepID=A0A193FWV9_9BORD|nr:hypothetical protein [Bordetella bronchialis]ANN71514.1 hypothetical protein BAU08_09360 [Bordetella bronchialis]
MPDISKELAALVSTGLVERCHDGRYRLTAAGNAYARARGLEGGPTQAAGQEVASGQEGLVHGESVAAGGARVPREAP